MNRNLFTEEQQQLLRQNPYIHSVTAARIYLTKEFKELFMNAYNAGESPRKILEDHGFDITVIGERRVWSISHHIRTEFKKYGKFHEGYGPRSETTNHNTLTGSDRLVSEVNEINQLRHEVDYLKQEIEFLKKISLIKTTRK